jgi:hypothetical protein
VPDALLERGRRAKEANPATNARPAETRNTIVRPWWRRRDQVGEVHLAREDALRLCGELGRLTAHRQELVQLVDPEHRGEEGRHRRQGRDVVGDAVRLISLN